MMKKEGKKEENAEEEKIRQILETKRIFGKEIVKKILHAAIELYDLSGEREARGAMTLRYKEICTMLCEAYNAIDLRERHRASATKKILSNTGLIDVVDVYVSDTSVVTLHPRRYSDFLTYGYTKKPSKNVIKEIRDYLEFLERKVHDFDPEKRKPRGEHLPAIDRGEKKEGEGVILLVDAFLKEDQKERIQMMKECVKVFGSTTVKTLCEFAVKIDDLCRKNEEDRSLREEKGMAERFFTRVKDTFFQKKGDDEREYDRLGSEIKAFFEEKKLNDFPTELTELFEMIGLFRVCSLDILETFEIALHDPYSWKVFLQKKQLDPSKRAYLDAFLKKEIKPWYGPEQIERICKEIEISLLPE